MEQPAEAPAAPPKAGAPAERKTIFAQPQAKELTLAMFWDWTDQCEVRQVQAEFEAVGRAAKAHGTTIDTELVNRGFTDLADFNKKCPRFSMWCDTRDLAELGSGFVLYFQLLRFLVGLLLLVFLCSIPAMVVYNQRSELDVWWWHEWKSGGWLSDDASDPCACIADNSGVSVPAIFAATNSSRDYGRTCGVWDRSWCMDKASPPTQVGRWCCVTWCFAGLGCPTPRGGLQGSGSLANRHYGSKGLVRSTTSCRQSPLDQFCMNLPDTAFNESADPPAQFTWKIWLTPGNLGPKHGTNTVVPIFYLFCVLLMCVSIMSMVQRQLHTDEWVESGTTMPNHFAIQVSGLPSTATDEQQIMAFFTEHAVGSPEDSPIVKVVIGWDAKEFREKGTQLKALRKHLFKVSKNKTPEFADEGKKILKQIEELRQGLHSSARDITSSGVAVVSFRRKSDLQDCLDRWTGFWPEWMHCSNSGSCLGLLPGDPLPTFEGRHVKVRQAPNPGDINWEDLGASREKTWFWWFGAHSFMIVLVAISFGVTYGCNVWQRQVKQEAAQSGSYSFQALSLLPAVIVSVVNYMLRQAAYYLAKSEIHDTVTEQEFSEALKTSYAMIINTSGVIFFCNAQPRQWYLHGGLVDDMMYMLVVDAIVGRLFFLIDWFWWLRLPTRHRLCQADVDELNRTMSQSLATIKNPKSPLPDIVLAEEELDRVRARVAQLKHAFEHMELDNPDRYARAITTTLVSVFYAPLLPLAPVLGIVGLMMQYGVDKWLLLRWCKRSNPQNKAQARWSLRLIRMMAPFGLASGMFIFITPSWARSGQIFAVFLVCSVACFLADILPLRLSRTTAGLCWRLCCRICGRGPRGESLTSTGLPQDYYEAQFMWPKGMKYHRDQLLYKSIPEKHNPDILADGVDAITRKEDLQAIYGQALRQAVGGPDRQKAGAAAGAPTFGGRATHFAPTLGVGASSRSPEPVAYGVSLARDEAESAPLVRSLPEPPLQLQHIHFVQPQLPQQPQPPTPSSSAPGKTTARWPAAAGHGSGAPSAASATARCSWEYETGSGFKPFADDRQAQIEAAFIACQEGRGAPSVQVETGGMTVNIDFQRMTQKVLPSGKVRKLRRVSHD